MASTTIAGADRHEHINRTVAWLEGRVTPAPLCHHIARAHNAPGTITTFLVMPTIGHRNHSSGAYVVSSGGTLMPSNLCRACCAAPPPKRHSCSLMHNSLWNARRKSPLMMGHNRASMLSFTMPAACRFWKSSPQLDLANPCLPPYECHLRLHAFVADLFKAEVGWEP